MKLNKISIAFLFAASTISTSTLANGYGGE